MATEVSPSTRIPFPAWSYEYTKPGYPARGFAAWVLLGWAEREHGMELTRPKCMAWLRAVFGFTKVAAYDVLKQGDGVFWKTGDRVELYDMLDLWNGCRKETEWDMLATVAIPIKVLAGLKEMRAWMAQGAMSRHSKRGTAVAWTGERIGWKEQSVRQYRNILDVAGVINRQENFLVVRRHKGGPVDPPEFVRNGFVWKRISDTVTLLDHFGQPVTLEVNQERFEKVDWEAHPRRWFQDGELQYYRGPVHEDPIESRDRNPGVFVPDKVSQGAYTGSNFERSIFTSVIDHLELNPVDRSLLADTGSLQLSELRMLYGAGPPKNKSAQTPLLSARAVV